MKLSQDSVHSRVLVSVTSNLQVLLSQTWLRQCVLKMGRYSLIRALQMK